MESYYQVQLASTYGTALKQNSVYNGYIRFRDKGLLKKTLETLQNLMVGFTAYWAVIVHFLF